MFVPKMRNFTKRFQYMSLFVKIDDFSSSFKHINIRHGVFLLLQKCFYKLVSQGSTSMQKCNSSLAVLKEIPEWIVLGPWTLKTF